MNIEIEITKDADLIAKMNKSVQDLHERLYPRYFKKYSFEETKSYITKQLEDENWFCYVAIVDKMNAGYAIFFIRNYEENPFRNSYRGIHIDQIAIMPAFRNKGIGKAIMERIELFAKQSNATQIELTHWEQNEEAKGFYQHIGFETNFRFVVKSLA